MARSLSNAQKAAASAVTKITGGKSGKSKATATPTPTRSPIQSASNAAVTIGGDRRVSVSVPGLFPMSEQTMPAMVPPYDPNQYSVTDPLNPPESIPQATVEQFERGKRIYEGGIRALQLTGMGMDLTREKFVVIGKQAKAISAGFNALSAQEQAKGSYLDYQSSLEATQQKGIHYQVAAYTTTQEIAALPLSKPNWMRH